MLTNLLNRLGLFTKQQLVQAGVEQFQLGTLAAKTEYRVLPLPFAPGELSGTSYGAFITPAGFAMRFGECTVPAPGPFGYEQRAYYVSRAQFDASNALDLHCHYPEKFEAPWDSTALVPVIVTVLR